MEEQQHELEQHGDTEGGFYNVYQEGKNEARTVFKWTKVLVLTMSWLAIKQKQRYNT